MGSELKRKLCNHLIETQSVELYQVIRHSYTNHRINEDWGGRDRFINVCPTLDTRCDCLGVVIEDKKRN